MTSDAPRGLKEAIAICFAVASSQRCRTRFMVGLLSKLPKRMRGAVPKGVRTIYQQPTAEQVHQQHEHVVRHFAASFPTVAEVLTEARPDILAFICLSSCALASHL